MAHIDEPSTASVVSDMSQNESPKRRFSILAREVGEKWPIFAGDFEYINDILSEKPSNSVWLLLQYFNALFRSFGQVIFANNPVSGVIIILAIGIANYKAMLAGLLASTFSFVFALIFRQDSNAILNGGYGFNPVLHGVVSVGALPDLYADVDISEPKFWLFLIITSIMSIYITSALGGLFKHIGKYPIPCFTLPFNILQFMLIFCLLNNSMPPKILSDHLLEIPEKSLNGNETRLSNATPNVNIFSIVDSTSNETADNYDGETDQLNWGATFSGTIVALAQVYGLNNIPCAALMYLALFVYSPMMTGFAYLGSLFGTLMGITFAASPQELYDGVWGYNGLLCAAALSGFCFVLNVQSTMIAVASVVFTTVLQHFMTPLFIAINYPILSMPFNLTTILFLFITTEKEDTLSRPAILTFPEQHRHQYKSISSESPVQGYLRRTQVFEGKDDV